MEYQLSSDLLSRMQGADPIKFLITNSRFSEIEQVYINRDTPLDLSKKTIIVITGPTGSGKDTILEPYENDPRFSRVITATTREKREGEDDSEYIWMRKKREDESQQDYINNLIKEYDLVESDFHNDNLYGIPRKSIEKASADGKLIILKIELNGLRSIIDKFSDKYNIVSIFIVPESYTQIWDRIANRDNQAERMSKAVDEVLLAPELVNYFILNKELESPEEGVKKTQVALGSLIDKVLN